MSEPSGHLLLKALAGAATPDEHAQVMAWVNESPEHQKQWTDLQRLWNAKGREAFPDFDTAGEWSKLQAVLAEAYDAFNAQDLARLRPLFHAAVVWPNTLEISEPLDGREAVMSYFARIFATILPNIQLIQVLEETGDALTVEAQYSVESPDGHVWTDTSARLIYHFRDGVLLGLVQPPGVPVDNLLAGEVVMGRVQVRDHGRAAALRRLRYDADGVAARQRWRRPVPPRVQFPEVLE